jgi:hypothetical protein
MQFLGCSLFFGGFLKAVEHCYMPMKKYQLVQNGLLVDAKPT